MFNHTSSEKQGLSSAKQEDASDKDGHKGIAEVGVKFTALVS